MMSGMVFEWPTTSSVAPRFLEFGDERGGLFAGYDRDFDAGRLRSRLRGCLGAFEFGGVDRFDLRVLQDCGQRVRPRAARFGKLGIVRVAIAGVCFLGVANEKDGRLGRGSVDDANDQKRHEENANTSGDLHGVKLAKWRAIAQRPRGVTFPNACSLSRDPSGVPGRVLRRSLAFGRLGGRKTEYYREGSVQLRLDRRPAIIAGRIAGRFRARLG